MDAGSGGGVGVLDGRISRLERWARRRRGIEQPWDFYQFRVKTTSPPSQSIWVSGGWYIYYMYSIAGWFAWYPPTTWEIPSGVYATSANYLFTFSGAGRYLPLIVSASLDWNSDTRRYDASLEFHGVLSISPIDYQARYWIDCATVEEAQSAFTDIEERVDIWGGIPMVGLILKNNGNVTDPWQFENIDPINRGRSFLFGDWRTVHVT